MDDKEDTAQELLNVGNEWAAAMVANDAVAIGTFMHDDWVIVSERGISTKKQFLSFVESGGLTHSAFEMSGRHKIMAYGDLAVLTCRVVNTAHFGSQTFEADEWATDVFVKEDGKWLCVHSHITAVDKAFESARSEK